MRVYLTFPSYRALTRDKERNQACSTRHVPYCLLLSYNTVYTGPVGIKVAFIVSRQ